MNEPGNKKYPTVAETDRSFDVFKVGYMNVYLCVTVIQDSTNLKNPNMGTLDRL